MLINRLLRAGFILRLQMDHRIGFAVEVFKSDGKTCIAFESGKTLDEAVSACLIHVIEAQAQTIQGMKVALDMVPESVKRFFCPSGPDRGTEEL